ncbi:MAG: polysaccharide deacetylase family protein [Chloroflexi bacterium]|nr:polysaccharide deacetylase family protein [Chloroflexota bacterium]
MAGKPHRKAVAFTFDVEEDTDAELPQILDLLDQHASRGTFFIRGQWAEDNPAALREIVRRGHPIHNHTWSHRAMTVMDESEIRDELQRTEEAVVRITGVSTKPYWRVPIGYRDARLMEIAGRLGYRHAWLSAFADPRGTDSPEKAVEFALARARNGTIYLYHPRVAGISRIVATVMQALRDQGYAFQTVAEIESADDEAAP